MYERPRVLPAGDRALVVELGDAISPDINRRVRNLTLAIERTRVPGVFDLVPAYRSVLVYYDPLATSYAQLQDRLQELAQNLDEQAIESPRVVHIPVAYGGEHGPDIEFVASHAGLTIDEVIRIHTDADYLVYMMGFSPGFAYMGGLSKKLVTPRLKTPRTEIPAGSVGIAESQTGIYPIASPGGWQLIGRTPLRMFDPHREPPAILSAGDHVRFVAIEESEYAEIQRRVEDGAYEMVTEAAQ
ncbi:MAG: 5-oxoprolinase subunit PxpB [Chloroflexi bacterium]|nr:5-oxoprolinase subunit PxpB [Chloroflexota bacterium]